MKTLLSILLITPLFTLTSFKTETGNFVTLKAPPITFEVSEDITGAILDGCDETLEVTEGTSEMSYFGLTNKKVVIGSLHASIHGRAVGVLSGKQYVIISQSNASSTGIVMNGLLILNNVASVLFIGQAGAANFKGKLNEKLVVNAKGQIIAGESNFKSSCK